MYPPSVPGAAREMGRVDMVEVALLVGATYGLPLVKARPSMPAASACCE